MQSGPAWGRALLGAAAGSLAEHWKPAAGVQTTHICRIMLSGQELLSRGSWMAGESGRGRKVQRSRRRQQVWGLSQGWQGWELC